MKKMRIWAISLIAVLTTSTGIKAQQFEVGTDIVSSYVWRGVQFSGVSIQPGITFASGGFSLGAWGSAGFDGFMEADIFAKYAFNFGLTVGLTDYYYPGTDYFDVTKATGAHGIEVNLGYGINDFSIAANYMLNEAGAAGTAGGDMYFELGYAFNSFSIFAGAGDGWHTAPDGKFGLVNIGLNTSKDIKITDTFSLPLSGTIILNPTTKQFFVVAGIRL